MTVEEFGALAAAWGADIARWPAERREAAEALAARSPAAAALLVEAGRLDRVIAAARPVVAPARAEALAGRVATAIAADGLRHPARAGWRTWFMPVTSLASAAVIGVGLGLAQPITPPMSGAEYLTAIVLDGAAVGSRWSLQ
jgi:hypothetical protein